MKLLAAGLVFAGYTALMLMIGHGYEEAERQVQLQEVLTHETRCVDLLKQCAELLELEPDVPANDLTVDGGFLEYTRR